MIVAQGSVSPDYEKNIAPVIEEKAMMSLPVEAGKFALEASKAPPIPRVLENIAWCESRNRHFDKNGRVLRGTENFYDVGKYQINTQYWGNKAKKLGHDLFTEEGNEAMALAIYEQYGTGPWKWSQSCWNNPG